MSPLYEYKCCEVFEKVLPLKRHDEAVPCPKCGRRARKVISAQVHGDEAPWIPSVNETLRGDGEPPITNRTEYKAALKRKGLEPVG